MRKQSARREQVCFGKRAHAKGPRTRWIHAFVALVLLVLGGKIPPVWGDIYSFRDENGVVHFSNVPMDSRYRFKMKESRRKPTDRLYESRRKRYDDLVQRAAKENGLDPDLLRAVVEVESRYDPRAVSRKGAVGMMQIMPETAERLGLRDPYHPAENLRAGARHLKALLEKYTGKLPLALAAYNAGEKVVDRDMSIPPYPETQNYVRKVMQIYKSKKESR